MQTIRRLIIRLYTQNPKIRKRQLKNLAIEEITSKWFLTDAELEGAKHEIDERLKNFQSSREKSSLNIQDLNFVV